MPATTDYRLLDAARMIADDVNEWLRRSPISNGLADQLTRAATSISLNVAEGAAYPPGANRARFLSYAHGSANEVHELLRTCRACGALPDSNYWRLHNRIVVFSRMIHSYTEQMRRTPYLSHDDR